MKQVKIFQHYDYEDLQKEINKWIIENNICNFTLNTSFHNTNILITIIYETN